MKRVQVPTPPSFKPFPKEDTLTSAPIRFEKQVAQYPKNIAVQTPSYTITYETLNKQANQLARAIIDAIGRETEPVGLLFDPGILQITSLIGSAKACKIWVPLDPYYPPARTQSILQQSESRLILTDNKNMAQATQLAGDRYQLLNIETIDISYGIDNLSVSPQAEEPAYIIFTSGSTGKPKGVVHSHFNTLSHIRAHTNILRLTPQDRVLQLATPNHVSGISDMFRALYNGGTVSPYNIKEQGIEPLADWLISEKITVYHSVPTVFRHLVNTLDGSESFPDLRLVHTGGEPLSQHDVALFREHFDPTCIMLNNLGSTEASSYRQFFIDQETTLPSGAVPVGYETEGKPVLLLDEKGQEVGLGEMGEITLKSSVLALGYWREPELTKQAFLPDPAGSSDRIYRTGDMGRLLPDGCLIHLGRKDAQVKIRGERVELMEVEAILFEHPDVGQTAVSLHHPSSTDPQLIAYVIPTQESTFNPTAFREFLLARLPGFMVPSQFVQMDQMPLTPTGKVDRKALPAPSSSKRDANESGPSPSTPTEQKLAKIWEELLDVTAVSTTTNFFELGGHSLTATQLISRIRAEFDIMLSVRDLFEHPTIATLATLIDQSDLKSETLAITPYEPSQPIPLSFSQQRLWILDQMEPENAAYHVTAVYQLNGPLNTNWLKQSLHTIVQRHSSLRTIFTSSNGNPEQIILDEIDLPLPLIDFSRLSEDDTEKAVAQYITSLQKKPFDIAQGPLLRTELIQLGKEAHILVLIMHHIISDGWSIGVLTRELTSLYTAHAQNQSATLPELDVQYADFAAWQRKWLVGERFQQQIDYWQSQLQDAPPLLELPTDRPRPSAQTYRGEVETLHIDAQLAADLRQLSGKTDATLFMIMLATFKLLLHRLTGQEDIVVGSPIAGRIRAELEPLVGFFLNNLVLRTDLSGTPTFLELVKRVRKTAVNAYANQEMPFEHLLEVLQVERNLSHAPLFQVFFNMLNVGNRDINFPDIMAERIFPAQPEAKFDLTVYIYEVGAGLQIRAVYNTDLFDARRMALFLQQYLHLLHQVSKQPGLSIDTATLVTERTRTLLPDPTQTLHADWHGSIHGRLAKWAQSHPTHLALVDPENSWTYALLNERANQLAHHLIAQGVQTEDVVTIYAHRSASLVWAVMGILKAGAAFAILDPAYPPHRLHSYLRTSRPSAMIALDVAGSLPPELQANLEEVGCHNVVRLPETAVSPPAILTAYPQTNPDIVVGPDNLAYISFTSGSTGQPKAVMGRHGPLTHFLPWQEEAFELNKTERFSMLSGLSHDPLQRDMFTALWVGATLHIPAPDFIGNANQFARWMADQAISFAHLTPPMSTILTEAASDTKLTALRHAFFVGDKLTQQDVTRLQKMAPDVTCTNSYGATETQRAVGTYCIVPNQPKTAAKAVYPVGRGMPDVQLLVLNGRFQLCGIGEVGEIHVRSPHLARGYLGDAELTQARFISNPFTAVPDDCLYKTGDLGRYQPDGTVVFVGRKDRQVKIRGFRIELGEIESALAQHPQVDRAIVTTLHDENNQPRLVAYAIVPQGNDATTPQTLRHFLREIVPDFMVPTAVTMLDHLPLTPNGKIDFHALPKQELRNPHKSSDYVTANNLIQQKLIVIWESVLKRQQIGLHDNFFDLGGHSLLAVQLFTKIEQQFGVNLPLITLFKGGTIAQLAEKIQQQDGKTAWSSLVELQPQGTKPPFYCVHGLTGDLLWFKDLAQRLGPDTPFYGFQARGLDGIQAPLPSIEAIATFYIAEIQSIQPHGPYYLGGASFGGTVALEMAQQLQQNGHEVAMLVMFDHAPRQRNLTLTKGEQTIAFLKNLPLWVRNFAKLPLNQMWNRLQRKLRIWRKRNASKENMGMMNTAVDLIDYAAKLPKHRQALIEVNFNALQQYMPKPYTGKVLLFQAQTRPLFKTVNPSEQWKQLANGNLNVQTVPGSHEGIFQRPNVNELAAHLKKHLTNASSKR